MVDVVGEFWRAPPVSRTLVAATFIQSALVFSGLLSYEYVIFETSWTFLKFPPELWRLVSSFLLTGPKLSFVFDLFFMWTYGTGLELKSARFTEPGSFFIYICFLAAVIVAVAGVFLQAWIFTSALLLGFMYTFAQDNRGTKAYFFVFQMPVELLPWATLVLALVMNGPGAAYIQGTGILAAHLYDFLTRLYPTFQGGRNYIRTPAAIRRFFAGDVQNVTRKPYGTSFQPRQDAPQGNPARGWTSGFSNNWGGRGAGRRLGGD